MAKGGRSRSGKNQRKGGGKNPYHSRNPRPAAGGTGSDSDAPLKESAPKRVWAAEGPAIITTTLPGAQAVGQPPPPRAPEEAQGPTDEAAASGVNGAASGVNGAAGPPRLMPPLASGPAAPKPELRPPYPRPDRTRRQRLMAIGGLALVVLGGVLIGLVVTASSGGHAKRSPVAAYLTAHVPGGTPVAVYGSVGYKLPAGYPTVPVSGSNLSTPAGVGFALAPDPLVSAGPAVTSYVLAHGSLLAVDHGRASLWALRAGSPAPPPAAATTVPAPVTTSPAPATTSPAPATTSPAPATTTPAPTTTVPVPATPAPAATTPAPAASPAPGTTMTVQTGQNFWSIAQKVVAQRLGATPTAAQVAHYWSALVTANQGHLPVPGNPNLLYPGTTVSLPGAGA